ncbi:Acg family FMN-binding oxidoreductase [Krasilnikovia sp. MM14-A1259]|uniref:Acg family FMN-binding oxidoreductase n=1 Tax=Krasilnikovia sp. MM14-A1259 TaxID=3373539 RepID=UPI00399CF072
MSTQGISPQSGKPECVSPEGISCGSGPAAASGGGLSDAALAAAVEAATAAPSLHNSQPWRFRVRDGGVDVFADRTRQLHVLDPAGRELLISCGAALFNLRLAIRAQGVVPRTLLPAGDDALVARVEPGRAAVTGPEIAALAAAVPNRHTNRWPFATTVVPSGVIEQLVRAATYEGARLTVAGVPARAAILGLTWSAERRLRRERGYRAELGRWTRPGPRRADGIPPSAIGPWDLMETMPIREFGLVHPPLLRHAERFEPYPTILVLATRGDGCRDWVAAGQALQRVLLTATVHGLATTPISQPVELPAIREVLTDTAGGTWAQMVIRIGYGLPAPATPRRPLTQVLTGV